MHTHMYVCAQAYTSHPPPTHTQTQLTHHETETNTTERKSNHLEGLPLHNQTGLPANTVKQKVCICNTFTLHDNQIHTPQPIYTESEQLAHVLPTLWSVVQVSIPLHTESFEQQQQACLMTPRTYLIHVLLPLHYVLLY